MKWTWPLPGAEIILHVAPHPGGFGVIRKFDRHTGMDIYCEPEQQVVAVEDGIVISIEDFTGENSIPPSPWWNNTSSVLVEGASGVVVYDEIRPLEAIKIGQHIKSAEVIGNVVTVLKKDKGLPMTMLHIAAGILLVLFAYNQRSIPGWTFSAMVIGAFTGYDFPDMDDFIFIRLNNFFYE